MVFITIFFSPGKIIDSPEVRLWIVEIFILRSNLIGKNF